MELVVYNMRARTAGARTILILRYTDILNVARFARSGPAHATRLRGRTREWAGMASQDGLCGSPSIPLDPACKRACVCGVVVR